MTLSSLPARLLAVVNEAIGLPEKKSRLRAGSLTKTAFAVAAFGAAMIVHAQTQAVTVVEYYSRALDAYFITGRSIEQTALDANPADFSRTGAQFSATAAAAAGNGQTRICRFYISTSSPFTSSHFYGREGVDCEPLRAQNPPGFSYEDFDFAVVQPDPTGACPTSAPTRVFRSFRAAANGRTSNHRYTVSQSAYDGMTAAGWSPERAVFCVTAARDADVSPTASFERVISQPVSPFAANCAPLFGEVAFRGTETGASLARNPSNPKHMVAAWQQDRFSVTASAGIAGAVTFDGGSTWTNTAVAFDACSGGTQANGNNYERASWPWVAIGPDGIAYQLAITLASGTSPTDQPSAILASSSTDGGRTWALPKTLIRDGAFFNNKPTLTADPFTPGYAYAAWNRSSGGPNAPAWFSRTTNGGMTWEPARKIHDPSSTKTVFNGQIVVLPAASGGALVYVFLEVSNGAAPGTPGALTLRAMRSADRGLTWQAPVTVAEMLGVGAFDPDTNTFLRDGVGVPSAAAGADGVVHVVWQDARFSASKHDGIAYSRSLDGGVTWSAPVAINSRTDVPAFTPTVSVRADGTVGVSYFDLRLNTTDRTTLPTMFRLTTSRDGLSWRESEISGAFDTQRSPLPGYYLNDNQGLSGGVGAFSSVFVRPTGNPSNPTDVVFVNIADGSLRGAQ
jgi:hypothetical protein